jgi:hypothetical protein
MGQTSFDTCGRMTSLPRDIEKIHAMNPLDPSRDAMEDTPEGV